MTYNIAIYLSIHRSISVHLSSEITRSVAANIQVVLLIFTVFDQLLLYKLSCFYAIHVRIKCTVWRNQSYFHNQLSMFSSFVVCISLLVAFMLLRNVQQVWLSMLFTECCHVWIKILAALVFLFFGGFFWQFFTLVLNFWLLKLFWCFFVLLLSRLNYQRGI